MKVSIVIPVYMSEDCLAPLVERIHASPLSARHECEIILVNDCSPDGSWRRIEELANRNSNIVGISLRKNFGQDCALMAGLRFARGDVVVIMDDDLQHDPAQADRLVAEVLKGCDVCYARFPALKQTWWKNAGSWLNDRLAVAVLEKPRDVYLSPFKAISRPVVDEVLKYDGPFPYLDGLLFGVTRNITQVDVEHHERVAGHGNFGLRKSVSTWLRVATSFSLAPLRLATFMGFLFAGIGFLMAIAYVIRHLLGVETPWGWASLFVSLLVLGGIQLACLGLIGEYLGRVFLHLNRRPQYVIAGTCGAEAVPEKKMV